MVHTSTHQLPLMCYNGTMNTQGVSSTTIKINLPQGILQNSKEEADRIGISIQDFIRMLMATYFANSRTISSIKKDEYLYDRAQSEIKHKQYHEVENADDLDTYFDTLDKRI